MNAISNRRLPILAIVFALVVLDGCGVMRPPPRSLYPDGPALSPDNAAVVNLMAYPDTGPAWADTEIEAQFPAGDFGDLRLPSTWVVLMPPGEYVFSFRHPCLEERVRMQSESGASYTVMRPVRVAIPVTIEAGRYYRVRYRDRPGPFDFEVYETSEDDARRFPMGGPPSC